ncbi:MAG: exonuclease [Bacillota bacterium]
MAVKLTFYDGVGCIGGNKIMLEAGGTVLMLDFGTNFGAEARFFDEFLRPRSTFGIGDLMELGLLPPLKHAYRPDLEPPGMSWDDLRRHPCYSEVETQGVLLTHGHVDHTGYVSYLRGDIPLYSSLTTAVIAKVMQDTTQSDFSRETCYLTPREVREGLLQASNYRQVPAEQRQFTVLDAAEVVSRIAGFWSASTSTRGLNHRPLQACAPAGTASAGGLEVRCWHVDHSIPGATAFAVRTPAGWVVYTGDLRLHGGRAGFTRRFMREAGELKPAAMICEGTHPGTQKPSTEEEVRANACEAVRAASGLVVADFGPRNVERLLSFLEAAKQAGRQLAVTARDAYMLEALYMAGESGVPDPSREGGMAVYVEAKAKRDRWEKELIDRYLDLCPERLIDARGVTRDPGAYVLCFSYYDLNELINIGVYGGTYIYSSCEPFNEEMRIDFDRLLSWIRHFDLDFQGGEGSRFHASGHIHGPGLEELVETVRPGTLIPVHTETPDYFRRFRSVCRVVIPEKGRSLQLD